VDFVKLVYGRVENMGCCCYCCLLLLLLLLLFVLAYVWLL